MCEVIEDRELMPEMELAVVCFNGRAAAEQAFGAMHGRVGDAAWTHEVALLEHHHNDRIALYGTVAGQYVSADEQDHVSQKGAMIGGIVGGLLGIPLGPPAFAAGVVTGGVLGDEQGRPDEIDPEPGPLVDDLRAAVPKGSSAIVLIAEPADVNDMLAALGEADGDIVRRPLSDTELATIEKALSDAPAASPGPRLEGDAPPPDPGDVTAA